MKLAFTVTSRGLSALTDSEAGYTNRVTIAEIGLSSTSFDAAPTLTALPGEFKRMSTVAGKAVSENILHLVARDDSDDTYSVSGLGLFLDNGVLFGVYSLDEELFSKSAFATFLFAADLTFEAGIAELIDFGDANFLYPPATETEKGVAYLATAADVAAGVDNEKIVTPAQLAGHFVPLSQKGEANGVAPLGPDKKVPPVFIGAVDTIDTFTVASEAEMLALAAAGPGDFARRTDLVKTFVLTQAPASVLGNWVEFLSPGAPVRSVNGKIGDVVLDAGDVGAPPVARKITATGLAKGGGAFNADRNIDVEIASAAETLAGLINDKAVTPASLALLLGSLANKVGLDRIIATAGLAQGGGDLSQNRTITVPKASAADVEAGTSDAVAVTPAALFGTLRSIAPTGFLRIPGSPLILQWGRGTHNLSHGTKAFTFPVAFPSQCFQVNQSLYSDPDGGDESDEVPIVSAYSPTGFSLYISGDSRQFDFTFWALGV